MEEQCEHEWIRMQYAEEEFKCVKCGETKEENEKIVIEEKLEGANKNELY